MRYHFTPLRMAITKKSTNNKGRRACGEREPSSAVGGREQGFTSDHLVLKLSSTSRWHISYTHTEGSLRETGKFYVRIINTLPDRLLTHLMKRSDTCWTHQEETWLSCCFATKFRHRWRLADVSRSHHRVSGWTTLGASSLDSLVYSREPR